MQFPIFYTYKNIQMVYKILASLFLISFSATSVLAQTARNIPRDSGPVEWTIGNILIFIVFPIFLIVFLVFYVRKLTREKLEEKKEREKDTMD